MKSLVGSENNMRVGIIGTGRIAERFVKTALAEQDNAYVECVFNPKIESAKRFSNLNQIEQYTDDINKFLGLVDVVYIASPHETHFEYARQALLQGKHTLCEKPMALKADEVKLLYALADENKCVLMEAIKTAYCPGFVEMLKIAKSGIIGEIVDVESAFTRLTPKNTREFENEKYGGSFLEFGSYVLLPIIKLLGADYGRITFNSLKEDNGVDRYTKCYIDYENKFATAKTGLSVKSEGQLLISGTKGYILAKSPWWMTKTFQVRFEDPNELQEFEFEYKGSGLQYEFNCFVDAIGGIKNNMYGIGEQESVALAGIMERFVERKNCVFRKVK